jgi:glucose-6-phosphate isomerase
LTNARSARSWLLGKLGAGNDAVARHFVALSTNAKEVAAFGIDTANMFEFWDWVGGRYSVWSAIGLSLMLAIGPEHFREFLAGAHEMDEHFRTAPLPANLPATLALVSCWYRDYLGAETHAVVPYAQALGKLPSYLEQLEMESNGKSVRLDGTPVRHDTSPIVWGTAGTNGQHAYFQMLHQGTDVIPLEFVAVRDAAHDLEGHHPKLLANALAQAQALMVGKLDEGGHKNFPGNRPSTFFVFEKLTPESLGAFLAMYEHRVFTSGALWGINSFDQWGVELGKVLARDIEPRLASGDVAGLDASTAGLLKRLGN